MGIVQLIRNNPVSISHHSPPEEAKGLFNSQQAATPNSRSTKVGTMPNQREIHPPAIFPSIAVAPIANSKYSPPLLGERLRVGELSSGMVGRGPSLIPDVNTSEIDERNITNNINPNMAAHTKIKLNLPRFSSEVSTAPSLEREIFRAATDNR